MKLSDSLVWALEEYDISKISVYCNHDLSNIIASSFIKDLDELWQQALESAKEEYGEIEEADTPAIIEYTDYGFLISLSPLEIYYAYGDFYDNDYGYNAFNKALSHMVERYPDIEYAGYVGYPVSDTKSGEALQYELSYNRKEELYDFVGETLSDVIEDEEFIENLSEQLENYLDFEDTVKSLYAYKDFIEDQLEDIFETILEVCDDCEEDSDELRELIESLCNDDLFE